MASRARNKLTVKQVAAITRLGVHSDGGGLYDQELGEIDASVKFVQGTNRASVG
jgi:hypothetical protein